MAFDISKYTEASREPAAVRDIGIITTEILRLKQDAGNAILSIGQRLIEAKAMLPHGEWLPWLTEQVEFSERTARNFMRLAREWTNRQALADLGAAKALTLLALPPEERRAVTSSTVVSPSTMAWEKATVRRMAVGAGISVIITDICALFSRRAIPVAKSPAPRMITSMENTPSSTDCRPEPDSPSGAPGPWHLPDSTASPPD